MLLHLLRGFLKLTVARIGVMLLGFKIFISVLHWHFDVEYVCIVMQICIIEYIMCRNVATISSAAMDSSPCSSLFNSCSSYLWSISRAGLVGWLIGKILIYWLKRSLVLCIIVLAKHRESFLMIIRFHTWPTICRLRRHLQIRIFVIDKFFIFWEEEIPAGEDGAGKEEGHTSNSPYQYWCLHSKYWFIKCSQLTILKSLNDICAIPLRQIPYLCQISIHHS